MKRYGPIIDQLSTEDSKLYRLGSGPFVAGVKYPDVAGLIRFRTDEPIFVDKLRGMYKITGMVGETPGRTTKVVSIFYDVDGNTLKNVPTSERVAFIAPHLYQDKVCGQGPDGGLAVLQEDIDHYLN